MKLHAHVKGKAPESKTTDIATGKSSSKETDPLEPIRDTEDVDVPASAAFKVGIVFACILVGMLVKLAVMAMIRARFGFEIGDNIPFTFVDPETEETWLLESYVDAPFYYIPYVKYYVYGNWSIYGGPTRHPLNGYVLGPLLMVEYMAIYMIVPLFYGPVTPTEHVQLTVQLTAIVFDVLLCPLAYGILRKRFSRVWSFTGAMAVAAIPTNVLYVDMLWLNISQMAFFTMLALYLLMDDRWEFATVALCFAWLSKQLPLFILPCWALYVVRKHKKDHSVIFKMIGIFLAFSFALSLPWIIVEPDQFFRGVFRPGFSHQLFEIPSGGISLTVAHSLLDTNPALEGIGRFLMKNNNVIFYSLWVLSWIPFFAAGNIEKPDPAHLVGLTAAELVLVHAFIPRGIYKYYDAFFMPFVLLSIFYASRSQIKNPHLRIAARVVGIVALFSVSTSMMKVARIRHPMWVFCIAVFAFAIVNRRVWREVFRPRMYVEAWDYIMDQINYMLDQLLKLMEWVGTPVEIGITAALAKLPQREAKLAQPEEDLEHGGDAPPAKTKSVTTKKAKGTSKKTKSVTTKKAKGTSKKTKSVTTKKGKGTSKKSKSVSKKGKGTSKKA